MYPNEFHLPEDDFVTIVRLGEILIEQGILNNSQVDEILDKQERSGRPFGDLAERMFDISACDIERAWVEQFSQIAEHVDPMQESVDPEVGDRITRRQAWQFGLLPLRKEERELLVATTRDHLVRATRFAGWSMTEPVYFVLTDPDQLEEALSARYPFPGMSLMRSAS